MRAHIPDYQLETTSSLTETLTLLANEPGVWRPFAGGTDLMVLLEAGTLSHRNYLNIRNLDELRGIQIDQEHITVGALTTYTEVQANAVLRAEFPMLCQAASETGGLAIQNRGTLGGNIVNASPAADSPPALLAYDTELELTSAKESRWLPYQGFHTGYKQMQLRKDELLTRIRLPRTTQTLKHYYRKVGTRKAQAISKVCFAAVARMEGKRIQELRIALGSVAPVPLRSLRTEEVLRGRELDQAVIKYAREVIAREIAPIDDIRSTRNYRLRISQNLLADFLESIAVTS